MAAPGAVNTGPLAKAGPVALKGVTRTEYTRARDSVPRFAVKDDIVPFRGSKPNSTKDPRTESPFHSKEANRPLSMPR